MLFFRCWCSLSIVVLSLTACSDDGAGDVSVADEMDASQAESADVGQAPEASNRLLDASSPEDGAQDTSAEGADEASDTTPDLFGEDEPDAPADTNACPPPVAELPEIALQREGRYLRIASFPGAGSVGARGVTIYLPEAYDRDTSASYPVLYMHDGQNLFFDEDAAFGVAWKVDEALDNLVAAGSVQPHIVVGVHNTSARISDYTPDTDPDYGGGGGEAYADWLTGYLKPFIDATLRTRCAPEHTAVAGSSLGGLISFFIGQRQPEVFGRVGGLSPSLWWNSGSLLSEFETSPSALIPLRLWLDAGTAEGAYLPEEGAFASGREDLSTTAVNCRRVVARADELGGGFGEQVGYLEVVGGQHNEAAWRARLEAVLAFLLGDSARQAPESLAVTLYRPRLLQGASAAVALEAVYRDGARLTWPINLVTHTSAGVGEVTVDQEGHLVGVNVGRVDVTLDLAGQSVSFPLEVLDPSRFDSVRFFVRSPPPPASGTVHLTGSLPELGPWLPDAMALNPASGGQWTLRVPLMKGEPLAYKYTLGSWETVEKSVNGGEVQNRNVEVSAGLVLEDEVGSWAGP